MRPFPSSLRTAVFLACLAVTACGFHLRGSGPGASRLPSTVVLVQQAGAAQVAEELRSQLQSAGANLTDNARKADYVIQLGSADVQRSVLSVSPRTGKVEEFQLTYTVLLSIRDSGGRTLVDAEPVSRQRDYTYDPDAILGKFNEEELLREELTREAADQILRRFSVLLKHR